MRRFVKFSATGLLACLLAGHAFAEDKKSEEPAKPAVQAPAPVYIPPKLDVPIPVGHDAQIVKLPYYGADGKLQMNFSIGIAKRIDQDRLQMSNVKVETFDDNGALDMTINMSTSLLNLETRWLASKTPVKIRNSQFELTGQTMRFNTDTREGKLIGHVRMLIFNRDAMTTQENAK